MRRSVFVSADSLFGNCNRIEYLLRTTFDGSKYISLDVAMRGRRSVSTQEFFHRAIQHGLLIGALLLEPDVEVSLFVFRESHGRAVPRVVSLHRKNPTLHVQHFVLTQ